LFLTNRQTGDKTATKKYVRWVLKKLKYGFSSRPHAKRIMIKNPFMAPLGNTILDNYNFSWSLFEVHI